MHFAVIKSVSLFPRRAAQWWYEIKPGLLVTHIYMNLAIQLNTLIIEGVMAVK